MRLAGSLRTKINGRFNHTVVHTVVHTVHTVVFYFEMYGAKLVKGTLQREEM